MLAEDLVSLQARKGARTSCETENDTSLLSRNEFLAADEGGRQCPRSPGTEKTPTPPPPPRPGSFRPPATVLS